MVNIFLVFLVLLVNCVACQKWQDRRSTVRISQGKLEGSTIYTESSKISNSYLGIPYAAPPIDDLRFAPPQRHPGWNGTFQADKMGPRCPQLPIKPGVTDVEDCLYLNIWTPGNQGSYSPLLPVVVFFEGIEFAKSSELPLSGQDLAVEGMIVVTVNYRLNVFGFFCLGTPEARGNLGILDQYFALLWIRQNIKEFGGDSEKLTLFGHRSGAASVTMHLISPRTAGLFQRAIISSGSALSPWQSSNDPTIASREILRLLGCTYVSNTLQCLRSKKVEHILLALKEYSESYNWTDMFLPVVDTFLPENNRYLPVEPSKALKEGTYLQVPILTGITKPITHPQHGEWVELASQGYIQLQQYMERGKIPEIMRLHRFTGQNKDQIFELIKWKYALNNDADVRVLFDQLKNLDFESKIEAPHFMQLSHLVSSYVQPIYVYYIDDIGFVLNTSDHLASTDLLLLFGPVLLKQTGRRRFNSNEVRLSNLLKYIWTNFINFGNPTPNNNRNKPWRKYTTEDPYIEHFDTVAVDSTDEVKKRIQRINFWNTLLPKIYSIKSTATNNIPRELQNSPDPAAGFRHAMYILISLVIVLLILLSICIVLLKKRSKDRERHFHMGY